MAALCTVITAFQVNWESDGGGGDTSANTRRSLDSNFIKFYYLGDDYNSGTTPWPVDNITHWKDLQLGKYYIFEHGSDDHLYYKNIDGNNRAIGVRPGISNLTDHHFRALRSTATSKRDTVDTVWGIGSDDKIDNGTPSNDQIYAAASSMEADMNGKTGHICLYICDGGTRVYDIKLAIYDDSYNPDGSACYAEC